MGKNRKDFALLGFYKGMIPGMITQEKALDKSMQRYVQGVNSP